MNDYITINPADILSLTSTRTDRITLPIKPQTDDVLFYAEQMIAEATPVDGYPDTDEGADRYTADCLRILDKSEISAVLTLIPHRSRISASVDLTVTTPNGQHPQRRYVCRMDDKVPAEIISVFFEAGAAGLRADFREYFERHFNEYNGTHAA